MLGNHWFRAIAHVAEYKNTALFDALPHAAQKSHSAAKENGAEFVALVEPDLFFSAQDRGPRTTNHPQAVDFSSREKFVGQPCSAELYANMLKTAGVDLVMTVHNHKPEVMSQIYEETFSEIPNSRNLPRFINLDMAPLIANYILRSGLVRLWNYGEHVGFVAPDEGAAEFVEQVRQHTGLHNSVVVTFRKKRLGQREVELDLNAEIELLKNRAIFVLLVELQNKLKKMVTGLRKF